MYPSEPLAADMFINCKISDMIDSILTVIKVHVMLNLNRNNSTAKTSVCQQWKSDIYAGFVLFEGTGHYS